MVVEVILDEAALPTSCFSYKRLMLSSPYGKLSQGLSHISPLLPLLQSVLKLCKWHVSHFFLIKTLTPTHKQERWGSPHPTSPFMQQNSVQEFRLLFRVNSAFLHRQREGAHVYEQLCLVVRAVITFLLLQLKGNVFNLTGMSKTSNVGAARSGRAGDASNCRGFKGFTWISGFPIKTLWLGQVTSWSLRWLPGDGSSNRLWT